MLSYHQNVVSPQVTVHDAHLEAQALEPSVAKFDLEFTLLAGDSEKTEITGSLRFAEALFDIATAETIAARVQSVARAVAADPETAIGDLDFSAPSSGGVADAGTRSGVDSLAYLGRNIDADRHPFRRFGGPSIR